MGAPADDQDGTITIRLRRSHAWALAGLAVGLVAGVLIGHSFAKSPRPLLYGVAPAGATTSAAESSAAPVKVDTAGQPARGPANAKVTMVEFVDFQCPYCGEYARDTLPRLEVAYGNRIRYVSRNFPLSIHPHAQEAAQAAECAQEQGGYWRYHSELFDNQNSLGRKGLLRLGKQAGLNPARLATCMDSRATRALVARDVAEGRKDGVTGTPTFFINGARVSGALPYAQIKAQIDAALH
jgi:protein-disulfide isomerase